MNADSAGAMIAVTCGAKPQLVLAIAVREWGDAAALPAFHAAKLKANVRKVMPRIRMAGWGV